MAKAVASTQAAGSVPSFISQRPSQSPSIISAPMSAAASIWKSPFSSAEWRYIWQNTTGFCTPREHHLVHQGALLAEAVGVVGHTDHHDLGVGLEAGGVFFGRDAILQHEELDPARHQPDKRHGRVREYRGYVGPGMGGTQRGALAEVGHQHGAFGLAVGSVVAVGAGPVGPRPAVAYIYIVGR